MTEQNPRAHALASKLAQLLGEVIVHHAPHTARLQSEATVEHVNEWLEGLEQHTAPFIAPFLQRVLDESNPPPEVAALIQEAIAPGAQFSTTLMQIFLWGIVSTIVGAATQPFIQGVSNELFQAAVKAGITKPVDPSVLATAAARGLDFGASLAFTIPQDFYDNAAESGIGASELDLAASIVGLPPALQELFEMYRRGIINLDQVAQGLREGDFRDDWIQYATQLIHAWPTPPDFVRAAVQAQMSYEDAQAWALKTGLDTTTPLPLATGDSEVTPDMFGLLFALGGRPPGPEQLARMALRGIIPWSGTGAGATTFQQGIAESDIKTKWTDSLQALSAYVPPPRTVGTLYEHGAITADQATKYWEMGGVPAELAAGYLYQAEQQHVGQDKLLAKGEILTAYYDGIMTNAQATEYLGLLGFRDTVAETMLAIVDFRREIRAINSVVSKVQTLYESFRISPADAQTALAGVGLDGSLIASLLGYWQTLRIAPVRVPSVAQIGAAVKYGTITQEEGLEEVAKLGYEPRDAAIVLSAGAEQQVTPLPAAGTTTTG